MTSSGKKYWALVRWVGGEDDKKYTVGIDVDHIKNFDCNQFLRDELDPEEVYVVEWRNNKSKPPLGGWLCYQARVIAVSTSTQVLERKCTVLEGIKSPKSVNSVQTPSTEAQLSKSPVGHTSHNNSTMQIEDNDVILETEFEFTPKKIRFSNESKNKDDGSADIEEENNAKKSSIQEVEDLKVLPTSQNITPIPLIQIDDENKYVTKEHLAAVLDQIFKSNPQPPISQACKANDKVTKFAASVGLMMKEIGDPDSKIFITQNQWNAAECAGTAGAMVATLLVSVFGLDVLAISNFKGGASKINKGEDNVQFSALDSDKLIAIRQSVKKRFKNFKDSEFGKIVNAKCTKIRYDRRHAKNSSKKDKDRNVADKKDNEEQ